MPLPDAPIDLTALSPLATGLVDANTSNDLFAASRQKIADEKAALITERGIVHTAAVAANTRLNEIDERLRKLDYASSNLADIMGTLDLPKDSPK